MRYHKKIISKHKLEQVENILDLEENLCDKTKLLLFFFLIEFFYYLWNYIICIICNI